jgi:DNA-binding beta-propeller fold protein YncE
MYVGSFRGITVYDPGTGALERIISKGVDIPGAIVVDKDGTLYVANGAGGPHGQGAIEVIARGASAPMREIRAGLNNPFALALDGAGNLYAANQIGNSVTEYEKGTGRLVRTITDQLSYPISVVVDRSGNVYVASTSGTAPGAVTVYAPGSNKVARTIQQGIHFPYALALDSSDNLYVANFRAYSVTAYRNGSSKVWHTFHGPDAPQALLFGPRGDLYVAGYNNQIKKFDVATGSVLESIETKLRNPRGIALDAWGNLAVAEHGIGASRGAVEVFAPKTGALMRTITKDILSPGVVAFGPR